MKTEKPQAKTFLKSPWTSKMLLVIMVELQKLKRREGKNENA